MSSISIPEPCHENWADFTPTQKGAFCGSCQIDVVDFSNKTPDEVKAILKENTGKHMCGRFRKSQLNELNHEFYQWENQSVKTFQSKFLYACLIVFGMTLFTSCDVSEQHFLGEVNTEWNNNSDEGQSNFVAPAADFDKDTTKKNKNKHHYRKGKIKYEPEQTQEEKESLEMILGKPAIQERDTLKDENCHIKGNLVVEDVDLTDNLPVKDTLEETLMGDTIIWNDEMVDGEIFWDPKFDEFIEDTTKTTEDVQNVDTLEIEQLHLKGEIKLVNPYPEDDEENLSNQDVDPSDKDSLAPISLDIPQFDMVFESKLYPNPVIDQTTVVIHVKNPEIFNVYLYAINGKMVKDIYKGMLASGRQEFLVDLTKYEAGSYLIVIKAGKQKESLRLEKVR